MYMLVDSSKARHPDEVVRLLSPTFAFTGLPRCLGFSYNVYGRDSGSLSVLDENFVPIRTIRESELLKLPYSLV